MSIKYRVAEVSHLGDLHTLYDITQYSWSGSTISFTLNDGSIHQFNSHKTDRIVLYKLKNTSSSIPGPEPTDPVDPEPTDPVDPEPTAPEGVVIQVRDFDDESATASVEVQVTRSDMKVAPEGVYFLVTGLSGFVTPPPADGETYDRQYHDLVYLWDFDDEGSTFKSPENIEEHNRNANIAYGPQVAHTYVTPGTYSPSVVVYEPSSGRIAKQTFGPFVVQDPDVVFAGDRTVYIDPDEVFDNIPSDWRRAKYLSTAVDTMGTDQPQRFMLRAGVDHPNNEPTQIKGRSINPRNVYICGEQNGLPLPTLRNDMFRRFNNQAFQIYSGMTQYDGNLDVVIHSLNVKGPWDEESETANTPVGNGFQGLTFTNSNSDDEVRGIVNKAPNYYLFHDVHWSGHNQTWYVGSNREGITRDTFIISDNSSTSWRDYSVFGAARRTALLGCRFARSSNAMSGGKGAKNGGHNQHGVLRMLGADSCVMDACDFFNNAGWFPNGDYNSEQPVLRWCFLGHDDPARNALNMQRCSSEGGVTVLSNTHMNDNKSVRNTNILFERNTILGSHMSQRLIATAFGGVTARRNRLVFPNSKRFDFHLYKPQAFVAFSNEGLSANTTAVDPIYVGFNTCVCLSTLENAYRESDWTGPIVGGDVTWEGIVEPYRLPEGVITTENNLTYFPNIPLEEIDYSPVDTSVAWTPRNIGYKLGAGMQSFILTEDVPVGGTMVIPYEGYYAGMDETSFVDSKSFFMLQDQKINYDDNQLSYKQLVSVDYTPSGVVLTNETTDTWLQGKKMEYRLDLSNGPNAIQTDPTNATPTDSVIISTPLAGSAAIGAADKAGPYLDFYGRQDSEDVGGIAYIP